MARKTTKTQTCDRCNKRVPEGELLHDEETGQAICGDCQAQPEVARPTGNECLCGCGAQVKGRYRPGHDARHVSQEAAAFVAADPDQRASIMDRLEKEFTPALMAKFAARVERLSARDEKVYAA